MLKFEKVSFAQFEKDYLESVLPFNAEWYEEGHKRYKSGRQETGLYGFDRLLPEFKDPERYIRKIYDDIKLPKRATAGSAGYDFYSTVNVVLNPAGVTYPTNTYCFGGTAKIPTGIRVKMCKAGSEVYDPIQAVLMLFPRSSMGFKYRMHLDNTVGIIDADYYNADNEGHIFIKITNDGNKELRINVGDAFAQGVVVNFLIADDDDVFAKRTGGMGSTTI